MREKSVTCYLRCYNVVTDMAYNNSKIIKQPCRDRDLRLHPQPRRLENPLISAHLMTRG